jgi:riboflavin synthase
MFTGLVEAIGLVRSFHRTKAQARLRVAVLLDAVELGESISVSGACLTVSVVRRDGFDADVSAETLSCCTLSSAAPGKRVNIERACQVGSRLGGHLVAGHVDGVAQVRRFERVQDTVRAVFQAPHAIQRYLAPKGSIAIDGVSLTINRLVEPDGFEVMLVPHTLASTTLEDLRPGGQVNLEADVLARYVARQIQVAGLVGDRDAPPPSASSVSSTSGDEAILAKLRQGGII